MGQRARWDADRSRAAPSCKTGLVKSTVRKSSIARPTRQGGSESENYNGKGERR